MAHYGGHLEVKCVDNELTDSCLTEAVEYTDCRRYNKYNDYAAN